MSGTSEITMYTKPGCVQCTASERALNSSGMEYTMVDMSLDDSALQTVKELGYLQAPVIVTPAKHWSGFRPDLIKETAQLLNAA